MDYWILEIDLVTRRFREDSGVIWRPEGRGGAQRFFLDLEIVFGDPEVLLDHEVLFGTRRSFL